MLIRPCLLALLVLVVGACASMKIKSDYDPEFDFSHYQSFDWYPDPPPGSEAPRVDNGLLASRIRRAVGRELEAKGYRPSGQPVPDFWIAHHVAVEDRVDVRAYGHEPYPGYRSGWGPYRSSTVVVDTYQQGTLLLDVIDGASRRLVWRGSAEARVSAARSPEERERRIGEAVRQILERFPPGAAR